MYDDRMRQLLAWLREQIEQDRAGADDDPDTVARCDAHSEFVDLFERLGGPTVEIRVDMEQTLAALAGSYVLQQALRAIASAYRHRAGYEEATAVFRQPVPEVDGIRYEEGYINLQPDELAPRRVERPTGREEQS